MKIVERYPVWLAFARGAGAWRLLFPLRLALAGLYGLGAWVWRRAARGRPRPLEGRQAAGRPLVVSVGNLEAGGGGKTPCVIALSALIRSRGGTPVVVTRAYRSAAEGRGPCVVAALAEERRVGEERFATEASLGASRRGRPETLAGLVGDEVVLYRSRGIPVVIDADRSRGAALAAKLFAPTHILLDDAYQNRSVAKDLDILLLDAARPFGNGLLLPAGRLREAPGAARRADIVIFTRARERLVPPAALRRVAGKHVFFGRHEPTGLLCGDGRLEALASLAGREVVLFSGIARPRAFEELVVSLGAAPRAAFRFEDHHRYGERDAREIAGAGGEGTLFVTTEKDLVKAGGLFPPGVELRALRIEMMIEEIDRLAALLGTGAA